MFDLENFPTRELARDMMGMISPIYDNSYVGKWIFEVMSVPLSLAQKTINELREQAFRKRQPGPFLIGNKAMAYQPMNR